MTSFLEDHRGKRVDQTELVKKLAEPSLTSVRTVWHQSIANALTPERLAEVLLAVDQNGDVFEYLTLAEEMEERDLHYHSVLSTRRLAVSKLNIVVEAVSDEAEDIKQADFVRDIISDEDIIRKLMSDQLDALGKGYSVSEIMWDREGPLWIPEDYVWRDPRFFQFDRNTGDDIMLRDERNPADGVPLAAYKFIVHWPRLKTGIKIRSGLARLAVVAFMCKGYSLKDWMAFAEVYGMPLRLGKYGSGASQDQKTELLRAVANIGTDAAAIIPESMEIEFMDGARSGGGIGEAVFERLSNWLDRQVSKGVLGQTMTTDDGSSLSQATVHNEVRADIQANDAVQLGATFRRDLVKPLIDLNFGPRLRRGYPILRLAIEEAEDLESLAKSLPEFIDRGLPVESSVILDKFGLEIPADDAILLVSKTSSVGLESPTQARQENNEIHKALMAKVVAGETLTDDQRNLLAMMQQEHNDRIDTLVNSEVNNWREVMNPIMAPILELAQKAETYDDFIEGLDELSNNVDIEPLVRTLATATLKSRGLGDRLDRV